MNSIGIQSKVIGSVKDPNCKFTCNKQRCIGKNYWYIHLNRNLGCRKRMDHDDSKDRIRFSVGNYFNSLAEADAVCDNIRELLGMYRGKISETIAHKHVGKQSYWYLYIDEIRPYASETTDRGRIIDSERAAVGNYLDEEDADFLSKQIANMLEKRLCKEII